ncbi:MAG: RNA-directed DNA polymerase, partial [Cyanobacteria bacterium J06621_15]
MSEQFRKVGNEEFILEEMIRYGFWSPQGTIPEDPDGEIRKELQELRRESSRLHNEQQLRKEALKQSKQTESIYVGEEVSEEINHNQGNIERLRNNNLPLCNTA